MPQNCRKKKQNKKKHHDKNNNKSQQKQDKSITNNSAFEGDDDSTDEEDDRERVFINTRPTTTKTTKIIEKDDKPYEIKISDIMGRYLVASRDLRPGELIIQESPVAVGPCTDSDPVCLGCYVPVSIDPDQYKCPNCRWPLCGKSCHGINSELGHSRYECALLREKRIFELLEKTQNTADVKFFYEIILPLRCLLLKRENPVKWENIQKMESHNDIRKKIPSLWNRNQEVIVNRIKNKWDIKDFTDDEIHTICGVLEVNCFEIGQNGAKARAIYPSAFLLSHECSPNTTHTDHPKTHTMSIRVTRELKKGEPITLTYAYTFQGTLKRREYLQEGKFFWCQCPRCCDPTELGTYSSAMRCPKCKNGIILSTEPLDQKAPWKCKACNYNVNAQSMFLLLEKIYKDLDSIDPHDIQGQEEFLERYRNVLTENHYLFISAKYTLCQLYGRIEEYLIQELSNDDLRKKERYCREVLKVVDILEPGLSRLRGVVMYELHAPIMILATRQFETKQISRIELRGRLKEVVSLLKESQKILSLEPEGSNEYTMALAAKDALKRIGSV